MCHTPGVGILYLASFNPRNQVGSFTNLLGEKGSQLLKSYMLLYGTPGCLFRAGCLPEGRVVALAFCPLLESDPTAAFPALTPTMLLTPLVVSPPLPSVSVDGIFLL